MLKMMNGLNKMDVLNNKLYIDDIKRALKNYDFNRFNEKKILITGATGLIGSAIVDMLIIMRQIGVNMQIFAAGRDILKIAKRYGNKVIPIEYDAMCPVQLPTDIDFIVHGAGNASPELYIKSPVETMLSNINGVTNLLLYCKRNGAHMLYISSSEVYGKKEKNEDFLENDYGYVDQDNIRNSYAEAKRASEMLCRSFAIEYNIEVTMIRPGHVFGPTASPTDKRISSEFAFKAARGERLEMLSAGLQKRSYCYCVDAACAILICLLNGKKGEAYNIGTLDVTSIKEMAQILAETANVTLISKEPSREELGAFNPMNNSALNNKKLLNIGFKQCFSAREGLEHTIKILQML